MVQVLGVDFLILRGLAGALRLLSVLTLFLIGIVNQVRCFVLLIRIDLKCVKMPHDSRSFAQTQCDRMCEICCS